MKDVELPHLPVIGAPFYCEFCRRQLIAFHEDGSFQLAGLAIVKGSAAQTVDEYGDVQEPEEMVITEATCFRRACRVKRWLRNHDPRGFR